jgi:hypothetical protein
MNVVNYIVASICSTFVYSTNAQIINVSTSTQLTNALNNAVAGQTIQLADGVYTATAGFRVPAGRHGTANNTIIITGSRNAVVTTSNINQSNCLWLQGNNYWVVKGFTVRTGKKGIMIDSSFNTKVDSVRVVSTGEEGIHLRKYSSYCTIKNCSIDSIGVVTPDFGEGIYIGSAVSNWCEYTACGMDTCNYNIILKNNFGTYVRAENIDVKEGTQYGIIQENNFNGAGLANANSGNSWMDVKGNYYRVESNTGISTFTDGIQTNIRHPGFGNFNTFNSNNFVVNASGFGFRIQTSGSNGTALNNVVCNNNIVSNATAGLSNIATQACGNPVLLNRGFVNGFNYKINATTTYFFWQLIEPFLIAKMELEYSTDGILFQPYQKLQMNKEATFVEKKFAEGKFFRLKIFSNQAYSFSNVLFVKSSITTSENFWFSANNQNISVFTELNAPYSITIYDVQGKIVTTKKATKSLINWQHHLKRGIYILVITDIYNKKTNYKFSI